MRLRLRHLLLALVAGPPLALFVAWLGLFNVGASSGHWGVTDWFLHFVMRASVRTWSIGVPVPDPLPQEALRPAAGHYASGCALCHGAPGQPRAPAVLAMLPPPPELAARMDDWRDAELHRIVLHGVRYTGMPAWPAPAREDEVWMMVAFLRALPGLAAADYAALTTGPPGTLPAGCSGCHGPDGRDGGPYVPRLAGQSEAYLRASLDAYAAGRRASGLMQQAVTGLAPADRAELARALAALPAGAAPPGDPGPPPEIATRGRPEHGVPACLACHGAPRRNPAVPSLDGQPAAYLAAQLRLFRDGVRGGGPYAGVMTRAAAGLADAEIDALAGWFAARAPDPGP
jgi:cytochrome c553